MPKVVYHLPDGNSREVDVAVGDSVMRGAVDAGVPGIIGECGGQMTCATCHVHVSQRWEDLFPVAAEEETDLLDVVDDLRPNSRLGCQLQLTEDHEGLEVEVPSL